MDPKTHLGPVVNKDQYERIIDFLSDAREKGAKIITGLNSCEYRSIVFSFLIWKLGGNEKKGKTSGFFVEPAVVADVKLSMKVAQEEIFGPIAAIIKWTENKTDETTVFLIIIFCFS